MIEAICDRVAIIDQSHIAEGGTVSEDLSGAQIPDRPPADLRRCREARFLRTSRQIRLIFDGRESSEPVISNLVPGM